MNKEIVKQVGFDSSGKIILHFKKTNQNFIILNEYDENRSYLVNLCNYVCCELLWDEEGVTLHFIHDEKKIKINKDRFIIEPYIYLITTKYF